jgi:hypothetical protein
MKKTDTIAGAEEKQAVRTSRAAVEDFERLPTIEELAAEQGVRPVESIDDLRGDFWPEDECIDEFLDWVYNVHRRTPTVSR